MHTPVREAFSYGIRHGIRHIHYDSMKHKVILHWITMNMPYHVWKCLPYGSTHPPYCAQKFLITFLKALFCTTPDFLTKFSKLQNNANTRQTISPNYQKTGSGGSKLPQIVDWQIRLVDLKSIHSPWKILENCTTGGVSGPDPGFAKRGAEWGRIGWYSPSIGWICMI